MICCFRCRSQNAAKAYRLINTYKTPYSIWLREQRTDHGFRCWLGSDFKTPYEFSSVCIIIPVHDRESITDLAVLCNIYIHIYILFTCHVSFIKFLCISCLLSWCLFVHWKYDVHWQSHIPVWHRWIQVEQQNEYNHFVKTILSLFRLLSNLLIIKGMNKQYKLDSPSILKESP